MATSTIDFFFSTISGLPLFPFGLRSTDERSFCVQYLETLTTDSSTSGGIKILISVTLRCYFFLIYHFHTVVHSRKKTSWRFTVALSWIFFHRYHRPRRTLNYIIFLSTHVVQKATKCGNTDKKSSDFETIATWGLGDPLILRAMKSPISATALRIGYYAVFGVAKYRPRNDI